MSTEIICGKRIWEIEQKKKVLNAELEILSAEEKELKAKLIETLAEAGKSSTGHIEGVGEFSLKRNSYLSVTRAQTPAFIEYLKDWGNGSLVKEVVEANTLKSFLEEKLEEITASIDTIRDSHGVTGLLNWLLTSYPVAHECEAIKAMTVEELEFVAADVLAAKVLAAYGVSAYQEIKLSHTKKGK